MENLIQMDELGLPLWIGHLHIPFGNAKHSDGTSPLLVNIIYIYIYTHIHIHIYIYDYMML